LADLPLARGLLFLEWIRKNTVYSLRPGNANAADPTGEFLFGNHEGHCVYFASAMTFLLRSQGIPARVVGGYAVSPTGRGRGSSILVQSTDGHAWCEIYLQGAGWIPLDASPERSKDPTPPPADDAARNQLREKFSNDNPDFRRAKEKFDAAGGTDPGEDDNGGGSWWDWLCNLWWLWVMFALLWLLLLYLVKVWRRLAPRFGPAAELYRLCYRATLDRLAEVGLLRETGETREDFAGRVVGRAPEFQDLTLHHLRCALGGTDRMDRHAWLEMERRLRQRLAEVFPGLHRFLGLINPLSWMWVK
jgi:hypothetical protein